MDIVTVFLYAIIDKNVYMELLEGYNDSTNIKNNSMPDTGHTRVKFKQYVYKIGKALYGLK